MYVNIIMFLQPKKVKYKKHRKGKLKKIEYKANKLKFGAVGLKACESGRITSRQIESARQAITRKINRQGKLWIRVFPSTPVTTKPVEVRMGKGKGSVNYWAAKVGTGSVIFEIEGTPASLAKAAFRTGGAKLPVSTQLTYR